MFPKLRARKKASSRLLLIGDKRWWVKSFGEGKGVLPGTRRGPMDFV